MSFGHDLLNDVIKNYRFFFIITGIPGIPENVIKNGMIHFGQGLETPFVHYKT